MRYYYITLLALILFSSCKDDSFISDSDFGFNYQPKTAGHWVEYAVDSTNYNDITIPPIITISSYFIREEIDTTFIDASGDVNLVIDQFRKNTLGAPWDLYQVGSFKITEDNFQRYFNDLRFINLIFPVRDSREWQGHSFLDVENEPTLDYLDDTRYEWNYVYSNVDQTLSLDSFLFDSSLVVTQIDEENLFEKKFSQEKYVRNVGLVSKQLLVLNTQAAPSGASFIDRAESGFVINWRLIGFKN
ncbi:MAG: hypothetical protein QNK51_05055 [Chitinophagales bacterium]